MVTTRKKFKIGDRVIVTSSYGDPGYVKYIGKLGYVAPFLYGDEKTFLRYSEGILRCNVLLDLDVGVAHSTCFRLQNINKLEDDYELSNMEEWNEEFI